MIISSISSATCHAEDDQNSTLLTGSKPSVCLGMLIVVSSWLSAAEFEVEENSAKSDASPISSEQVAVFL